MKLLKVGEKVGEDVGSVVVVGGTLGEGVDTCLL